MSLPTVSTAKVSVNKLAIMFDDESLGPIYPDAEKYTIEQLKSFVKNLAEECFWFTEDQDYLKRTKPEQYKAFINILFDSDLCHIRCVLSRCPNPSKNLYLRLLQCFLNCLDRNNAYCDYEDWLMVSPLLPPIQMPSVSLPPNPQENFNPDNPSSSSHFLENPF